MHALTLLSLLAPIATAFHLPTAQDALGLASDLLESSGISDTILTPASDITLASIPSEEEYIITSAEHPVSVRND